MLFTSVCQNCNFRYRKNRSCIFLKRKLIEWGKFIRPEGDIKDMNGYTGIYHLRAGTFITLFELNYAPRYLL